MEVLTYQSVGGGEGEGHGEWMTFEPVLAFIVYHKKIRQDLETCVRGPQSSQRSDSGTSSADSKTEMEIALASSAPYTSAFLFSQSGFDF